MKLIKIEKFENGGHDNMTIDYKVDIPEGWALIPDGMETPNFPFGDVVAREFDGVMTVTSWIPGTLPEKTPAQEEEPAAEDDINAMLVDHEYRLTLIELGVNE